MIIVTSTTSACHDVISMWIVTDMSKKKSIYESLFTQAMASKILGKPCGTKLGITAEEKQLVKRAIESVTRLTRLTEGKSGLAELVDQAVEKRTVSTALYEKFGVHLPM